MSMRSLITPALITVALALPTPMGTAYAKNGGQGGGGGHEGSSGNHGGSNSGRDKSDRGNSKAPARGGDDVRKNKGRSTDAEQAAKPDAAERAGLNSIKRNYQAYLNSNDPRFAGVFAYVRGYAKYELANGVDTVPAGSEYSDETLREALATAAGTPTVSDSSLEWAKTILGVGDEVGKIDQVRHALANSDEGN
ncbi:hypothetical protein P6U16_25040 (plasmid) [Rhizobium sp. 32-5/1]|uniref:hypothetical protein n=1 Tax=Rhizobium sp. 32-5/1 TaxID=3019602 RepID=UPI00240E1D98|nr:hypothetical protein [Rhizobium sp. 32-5/1]WEZ85388.1 hypothetical protein P6U16_25040 [Rhizobium sp. 32-5/1]